jgi:bifunctional DNase/RNase
MKCDLCKAPAVYHITLAEQRICLKNAHLCDGHASEFFSTSRIPLSGTASRENGEVLVDVRMVVISENNDAQVVYLCEEGGTRQFPVAIGIYEATNIYRLLKRFVLPRPLTHSVMANIITALGGELRDVVFDRLEERTYFALLRILQDGYLVEVDTRPSDAISLAVTSDRPIYVREEVFAEVARLPK